jgi:dihydroorotase
MVGLETAVPLTLDKLVRPGVVSLMDAVAKLSWHPAKVLVGDGHSLPAGVDPRIGTLQQGAPGDVTILDLDRQYVVEPEKLYSRSKNTPFTGWELTGAPVGTIVNGKIVMQDGLVTE